MTDAYNCRWGAEVKKFEHRFHDIQRLASISEALFEAHFSDRLKVGPDQVSALSIHEDEFEDFAWVIRLVGRWTREVDELLHLAHERACGERQ